LSALLYGRDSTALDDPSYGWRAAGRRAIRPFTSGCLALPAFRQRP